MDDVREKLQEIFQDVFEDPELILDDNMTADEVEGWDSLAHINLIIAIEKQLGVKFATAEISRMKEDGSNVGGIIELVVHKLKAA